MLPLLAPAAARLFEVFVFVCLRCLCLCDFDWFYSFLSGFQIAKRFLYINVLSENTNIIFLQGRFHSNADSKAHSGGEEGADFQVPRNQSWASSDSGTVGRKEA